MSAQPLNTSIAVSLKLRTVRDNGRHTSVKALTAPGFVSALVAVPGKETQVVADLDASFKSDAWRYGHQVTILPRAKTTVAQVFSGVTGMDFPVRLTGNTREMYLQKTAAHVGDDLYGQVAAL